MMLRLCQITPALSSGGVEQRIARVIAGLERESHQLTWIGLSERNEALIASAGTVATGAWVEFDVTAAVSGSGLVSFLMTTTSSNSCLYSSRQGANPPELIVHTASP